jgi:hypothetical protein
MNVNSNIYGLLFLKEYPPKMAVHKQKGSICFRNKKIKYKFPGIEDGKKEFLCLVGRNKNNMPRNK